MNKMETYFTWWFIKRMLLWNITTIAALKVLPFSENAYNLLFVSIIGGDILAVVAILVMLQYSARFHKKRGIYYENGRQKRDTI